MSPCRQEVVPSYLATSPILSTGEDLMEKELRSPHHLGRISWEKRMLGNCVIVTILKMGFLCFLQTAHILSKAWEHSMLMEVQKRRGEKGEERLGQRQEELEELEEQAGERRVAMTSQRMRTCSLLTWALMTRRRETTAGVLVCNNNSSKMFLSVLGGVILGAFSHVWW